MANNQAKAANGQENDKTDAGLHYLWHLQAIDLISNDGDKTLVDVPAPDPNPEIRVAIIDNGCAGFRKDGKAFNAFEHPNLQGTRLVDPIDFSAYVQGLRYMGQDKDDWSPVGEGLVRLGDTAALETLFADAQKKVRESLKDLINQLLNPKKQAAKMDVDDEKSRTALETAWYPELPDPSDRFAAHGTCCAGLVAASADEHDAPTAPNQNPNAIAYRGVNPAAHIIPISTVYNQEYWPLICALLWAVVKGADVILIPRGMEEMGSRNKEALGPEDPDLQNDLRTTRFVSNPTRFAEKRLFEALLKHVSDRIPVVMAAGNDGSTLLSYPASLKFRSNSSAATMKNLVVAGAVTARGEYASYTSGLGESKDAVLYAPSDDAEEISDRMTRFDDTSWRARHLPALKELKKKNCYSPYGVLAIDIPGQYGYVADPGSTKDFGELHSDLGSVLTADSAAERASGESSVVYKKQNLPRALYTTFGGTSAAASILAGIISLYIQYARLKGETVSPNDLVRKLEDAQVPAPNLEDDSENSKTAKIVSVKKLLDKFAPRVVETPDDKRPDAPIA
ncbi:peptidase S8 [Tateyamaria omphalii]|uniref:S8/S53 family peptidase n=1 Tax=Tateyamaria omphalii TaxID=299262 RepID=UPI00167208F6|nr:S8/S53 family peptidase [Tateyamaria omphalii]GGX60965.1 peptidase S8 [Tateyamaria omphalii]